MLAKIAPCGRRAQGRVGHGCPFSDLSTPPFAAQAPLGLYDSAVNVNFDSFPDIALARFEPSVPFHAQRFQFALSIRVHCVANSKRGAFIVQY